MVCYLYTEAGTTIIMHPIITPWRATSVQVLGDCAVTAPDRAAAWQVIEGNIARAVGLIEAACAAADPPKLFVLPEFFAQGAPLEMSVPDWIELACCTVPGPITAPLQQLARRHAIFIGANQFERAPEWPGRYFNTSFLIDPAGEVILRYRRVTTAAFPSPHDFMDDYLVKTDRHEVFPVVDTKLGRIAMIPCSEINVPEVARVMMMQGAEIILHPTNGPRSAASDAAKIARCAENKFYFISANIAGPIGFSADRSVMGGRSRIIDFNGEILSFEESAEQTTRVSAMIDVEALRKNRIEDSRPQSLLRSRWEMYRPFFAEASFYPPNGFLTEPMRHMDDTEQLLSVARGRLVEVGEKAGGRLGKHLF